MASDLPVPKSYEQILSEMLSAYASKQGINDFLVGSAVTSFFEVNALSTARASGDLLQVLRDFSVDRATGDTLKRLAAEDRVIPITASPTTGAVTIIDTSFNKISTKIYAGANPPNVGSTQIKVSDASAFPPTGNIYIGRGTPNIEGPLPYSSITPMGGIFLINLTNPTTKFHNLGETVILAQGGNRAIPKNTIVVSPAVGATTNIQYSVVAQSVILDGETEVSNVQIVAQIPGAAGNVPTGAIKQFASPPFAGASVFNPLPLTSGSDSENDDQLRVRIKRARASKGLGTATAVKAAVIGATASDEQATIVSDSMVQASYGSVLFIDNGTGYEAKTAGVGLESIVDSAIGGEKFFQLATGGRQAPVAKAFLESTLSAPFDLIGGDTLAVIVGGVTYEHVFADSDFISPGGATAFEVTASINANTALGFEASTTNGAKNVVIRAINEGNDSIKITDITTNGRDAAVQLGFPDSEVDTLRLYKNNIPLSKDGNTASIFTQGQALWSPAIANGDTLILSVDGTAPITYTMLDADFIATGLYTSVSSTNSLASWVLVLNAKLTGVTVTIVGEQLEVRSNLGANNRAQVVIDPSSTLVSKGMFSSSLGLSSQGKASDFILDRNTAQVVLVEPLVAGDQLSAGSSQTEARIQSTEISSGSINFTSDAHIWILNDNPGTIVATGVAGNTLLTVTKPATNVVRYTSSVANAFANVILGDYVIIWSNELNASNRLEGRVNAVTANTLDLLITSSEWTLVTPEAGVLYSSGFVVLRSSLAPQKFRIQAGNKTLDQIVNELQAQTIGLVFSALQEAFIVVKTNSKDDNGRVLIVTSDTQGAQLGLASGSSSQSVQSLVAFYDSNFKEAQFPLFVHSSFAAGAFADPIDSFINTVNSTISLAGRDPNELLAILHPYGSANDAQPYGESVQETAIAGNLVGIIDQNLIRRLRSVDRYFIANPLDFGSADTAVAIVDGDAESKSFAIPFFRTGLTNTGVASNPTTFNAYDSDSGPTTNFSSSFGANFDFANFKVLMQAKKVLKEAAPQTALLYRAAKWGRSGEFINVGYYYPSAPNTAVSSTVMVGSTVDIAIFLASGAEIPSSIDNTTEWNVTITPNTPSPGTDQVTYTWNTTGTNPALTLSGGEYVNISNQTEFSEVNTGIFRLSTAPGFAPTATSFTVARPTGVAVPESNRSTLVNGSIVFYAATPTTAAQVATYVNSSLSDYISATIVNDGGMTGSGVIVLSTFEEGDFAAPNVALLDGINWIDSSNISGSPQFAFKLPLALPADVGYAFNNGEVLKIIPTTVDQVLRFLKVLAVTGFTTVGTVSAVDRSSRISLATNTLGSNGSIQVIGGQANAYEAPILDSTTRFDNSLAIASVNAVAGSGIHSDQWFKLEATTAQSKLALFSSNSSIAVVPGTPTAGESTVYMFGRATNQRYFGKPRHHIRPEGRTFRIEKQGAFVCLSWDNVGTSPSFIKSALNFNDSLGGELNVSIVANTSEVEYIITDGDANFNELSIGDLLTVSGMSNPVNNGTFLVTGVSADGQTARVLNPAGANQYSSGTFTFSGNSTAGDTFTIGATNLVAGTDFAIGATQTDTAQNLAVVAGTVPGVTASANGSVVTVTAITPNASIALSYSGTPVVTVSGSVTVGETFVAGQFTASSAISEGDNVILSAPFNILNRGKFRIIRRFNDSVWFENNNVVEEEVTLPLNSVSLGFSGTTSFSIDASNYSQKLVWDVGVGTEPTLGNAQVGDIITFGTDFLLANRGSFMVKGSGQKLPEITVINAIAGSAFAIGGAGKYFTINSAGNLQQYYVWFNVNASNSDPAPGGLTGIQVAILSGDNATQVATKIAAAVGVATGLSATSNNAVVTVTTTGFNATTDAANVNVPAPFTVAVSQNGRATFVECINPSAVSQSGVLITDSLVDNRPQMLFYEYDAAVPGDQLVITGSILTLPNAGSYTISRVLDQDTVAISSTLAAAGPSSMNGLESSVFVLEEIPYTGYKRVKFVSGQPGAPTRNAVVFDTNAQYEKINESAGVQIQSTNKVDFPTLIKQGLDSYKYNTGLIAEANRIIYGDPRDPVTYPGVGAAGADIFVREPLALRILLGIVVRLNTGVPFAQTAQQVRTNVSSLINSNPVGESIAISAIVAAVNNIPGVKAVSISSPQYDTSHDIIRLTPSQKAIIINQLLDISVSQVNT